MKNSIKTIFLLFAVSSFALAQTADEVIAKYTVAVGGKELVTGVKSYSYNRSYKANASTDYSEEVTVLVADNKLNRKKSILERDFFYVLNGNSGWIKIPMGSRDKAPNYMSKDLNGKEVSDLSEEISDGLAAFVDYKEKGYTLIGGVTSEKVENTDCDVLKFEKGGNKKTFAFDKNTGLLKKEEIVSNGITTTIIHTKYGETKTGLKYPTESNYYNTKDKKNVKLNTDLTINVAPEAAMFVK